MNSLDLNLNYTPAQLSVFDENNPRFVTIAKGRRLGFTKGCANFVIENLLLGAKVLWVDTVQSNLQNYFEIYFVPELTKIPKELYSWSVQDKKLTLLKGILHMRSAERPENIEGLGYDLVILNEAGIILKGSKGEYLWNNAISPMLLDNPQSRAIIGGVPKGKNLFYELCKKELSDTNWKHFQFSSFDNPLLEKAEIERLIAENGGEDSKVVRQEIYGEFIDNSSSELFSLTQIESAMKNYGFDTELLRGACVWGVDVARFGDDKSVLAVRNGLVIEKLVKWVQLPLTELANRLLYEYNSAQTKPQAIFIDTCGLGAGLFDILQSYHLPVFEANSAFKASEKEYLNKRAQMYFNLAKTLPKMQIIHDDELKKDLRMIEYQYSDKGLLKIISKDELKRDYGKSPDSADAVALCFFEEVFVKSAQDILDYEQESENDAW